MDLSRKLLSFQLLPFLQIEIYSLARRLFHEKNPRSGKLTNLRNKRKGGEGERKKRFVRETDSTRSQTDTNDLFRATRVEKAYFR